MPRATAIGLRRDGAQLKSMPSSRCVMRAIVAAGHNVGRDEALCPLPDVVDF
jgi:hypothetical protein